MTAEHTVSHFLKHTRRTHNVPDGIEEMLEVRPGVQCKDGLELSIQASRVHYCCPRDNDGPYSTVEVGFPNREIPELRQYAEEPDNPTETVYGGVPTTLLDDVLQSHGGIVAVILWYKDFLKLWAKAQ